MHSEELINKVKNLPHVPGIYIYRNLAGKIIYVGKAKDLRNRVNSYFQGNLLPGSKTYALVQNIRSMAYIEALSELEAIILEAALIKKHKPKYNISLKDDKSYIYLIIRNEPVLLNNQLVRLPSVLAARETDVLSTDTKFGPYPHGDIAKDMARVIRKSLPFRDCSTSKFQKYNKLNSSTANGLIENLSDIYQNLNEMKMYTFPNKKSQNLASYFDCELFLYHKLCLNPWQNIYPQL